MRSQTVRVECQGDDSGPNPVLQWSIELHGLMDKVWPPEPKTVGSSPIKVVKIFFSASEVTTLALYKSVYYYYY